VGSRAEQTRRGGSSSAAAASIHSPLLPCLDCAAEGGVHAKPGGQRSRVEEGQPCS
jgi:hypothetical protein